MQLGKFKATVFDAKKAEKRKNTVVANLSTLEGKDQDDKNKYCSWRTFFVGNAYEKALVLEDKDRIFVTEAKIENFYNKEQEKNYVQVTVFDFDEVEE